MIIRNPCFTRNLCFVTGCTKLIKSRGMCVLHYNRFRYRNTLDGIEKRNTTPWNKSNQSCCVKDDVCSTNGHVQQINGKWYCTKHYMRVKWYGSPYTVWLKRGSAAKCYKALQRGYNLVSKGKGFVAVHRMVAEKALGRKLCVGEIVHHVNGNKRENRNSNLVIMTREYHSQNFAVLHPWLVH